MSKKALIKGSLKDGKIILEPTENVSFKGTEFVASEQGDIVILSGHEQDIEYMKHVLQIFCKDDSTQNQIENFVEVLKESFLDILVKSRRVKKPKTSSEVENDSKT